MNDNAFVMSRVTETVSRGDSDGSSARAAAFDSGVTHERGYAGLLPLLRRLDARLAAAVEAAERVFAARAAGDLYRGLAISPADVVAALGRVPGEPFLSLGLQTHEIADATSSLSVRRLLWLQRVYGLTDFDLDVILVGLAPEIDLRYERLYAYLQDDVTRRRPSIDLALNVLCASAGEKLRERERFAPDAPLVRNRLIEIYADPHHPDSPLLSRHYRLDEQIVRLLLLDDSLDSRLAAFCEMAAPLSPGEGAPLTEAMQASTACPGVGPCAIASTALLSRSGALRAGRGRRAAGGGAQRSRTERQPPYPRRNGRVRDDRRAACAGARSVVPRRTALSARHRCRH